MLRCVNHQRQTNASATALLTTTRSSFLLVTLLLVAFASGAHPQVARRRGAIWVGVGGGSGNFTCDTCVNGRLGGWAFYLGVGPMLSPHVRLGVEFQGWMHGLNGDRLPETDAYDVLVTYYPRVRGGAFVEAGGGISYYALVKGTGDPLEPVAKDTVYTSGTGWGSIVGVGWERGAAELRVRYTYGNVGELHAPGRPLPRHGSKMCSSSKSEYTTLEAAA